MLPGMMADPVKLARTQAVTKYINGIIRVDYGAKSVTVSLSSSVPEAAKVIPELLESFGVSLAQQFSTMFAIQGEIIEVDKPPEMNKPPDA